MDVEDKPRFQYIPLIAITLLAIVLRFYKLGEWSFWGDEYITVRKALAISEIEFKIYPFSLITTRAAMNIWGVTEWSARFASASIGILSVPVLYFLVRKIFDPVVALITVLLLTISPWHIYWSQNARFYTALLLFFTLALALFYFGIEEDKPWYLILSLGFLGLALKERLIAGLFVPIVIAYVVFLIILRFEKPKGLRFKNLLLFFGFAFLGAIILILRDPSLGNLDQFRISFGFVNNNPIWVLGGALFYIGIPVLCLSTVGAIHFLLKKDRATLFFSIAGSIPIITVVVNSLFLYSANRYAFISLPSIIILASLATKDLFIKTPKNIKILAVGILLILIAFPMGDNFLYFQYQNGNRDKWKDAFALITEQKNTDDLVVTTHRDLADYYLQEKTLSMQSQDISKIIERQRRTWFVIDLTTPDKAPQIYHWILQNTRQVANLDVHVSARTFPMRIYLYDP